MTSKRSSCIVIGGGISGLCTAYWLSQNDVDVTVLERESKPGGAMKTVRQEGYLIDIGPNSALETTPLFQELFKSLGIIDHRVYANEASSKRYILRNGSLHPLPMSPGAFLKTKLWSTKGKLRLMKEPFIGRADHEESIAQFVERRLGREFLDYAINPFVAGVYAGNPEELSVRSAFPKLYRLEDLYGGLIKGMIKGRKERKQRAEQSKQSARMFSFLDGMETFPEALASKLGNRLLLDMEVAGIEKTESGFTVSAGASKGETDIHRRHDYSLGPLLSCGPPAETVRCIYSGYACGCVLSTGRDGILRLSQGTDSSADGRLRVSRSRKREAKDSGYHLVLYNISETRARGIGGVHHLCWRFETAGDHRKRRCCAAGNSTCGAAVDIGNRRGTGARVYNEMESRNPAVQARLQYNDRPDRAV
jgi:hypothetical protein